MHHSFFDAVRALRLLSAQQQTTALHAAMHWSDEYLREQETDTDSAFPMACDCDKCVAVRGGGGKIVSLGRPAA